MDIWHECSAEISRCLHDKINELLVSDWHNVKLFHGLKMLKKILYSVKREGTSSALLTHALQTIKILIIECVHSNDLVTFGHFVASLVADTQEQQTSHMIELRGRLLDIVDELIAQQTKNKTYNFQEEIVKVLVFDFVRFVHESIECAHHCGKVGQDFVHASFESEKFEKVHHVHQQCRLATRRQFGHVSHNH
ncbi:hypothetical protein BpHYR1_018126 [Brachionus plicatilis]|uniref:Uncharacterized protein n=1 Tax=Brachionus plicatilis TaxID=10195 RepID=A0A3M7RKG1_BRAPC|nr:hypothetical protein BpHYR1_018126 [Brachionus plicatilis]